VLKDESTLDKNQVTEDKFLIVMLCKVGWLYSYMPVHILGIISVLHFALDYYD
jgi:hypothetical protein